jgi:aspartyl protease family protein
MPEEPWRRPPTPHRWRVAIYFGVLAAVGIGIWQLSRLFPETSLSGEDRGQALYMFALLAMVTSGVVFSRQFRLGEALRNIALWAGIFAVLGIGYLYQDVLSDIGTRLRGEFLPGEPLALGPHTLVLTESESGNYFTVGEVNGVRVRFLVDTGASDIVLSPQDAKRIGIDLATLSFSGETETANGLGHGAPFTVDSLAVGAIRFSDVAVSINQAPMDGSLLGMAFLRRLKSFEIKGRKLYLHW